MRTVNVIEGIFFAALEMQGQAKRAAYLDEACKGDAELRRCVERMLAAQPKIGDFLQPAAPPPTAAETPPLVEKVGTVIGPYKLLQVLGEGGFGVVFLAEQSEPVRRKVALKIIKPGMDSKQVVGRFEAERQALALMDHPNIARVLDGGTTDSGRPYFVMELVKGVPITEFCDQNRLSPRERLELFIPVCQAVQHAHQKGIIHRDLKPSNVLVTLYDDKPVPKVIDFGVAKAIEQKLTEQTYFTRIGQIIGTLEYMSPEQASLNALDVDTRADVYALGVLLYELLTGTTPLNKERLEGVAFLEMLRLIREEEPPRPSTRLSESGEALTAYAVYRKTETQKLPKLVKGELDWIAMKALEKDRGRRYPTANALAADVQRYLRDERVDACPPTLAYRLQKYGRKHRAALTMAGMAAGLLLLGSVVSGWQAVRAIDAEALAMAQLKLAMANEEKAHESEKSAQEERNKVQRERDDARDAREKLRRAAYISDMNLVQAAWEADDTHRFQRLLDHLLPGKGEADLRGFEWHYWNNQRHQQVRELAIPQAYSTGATSIAAELSGDGRRLVQLEVVRDKSGKAVAGADGKVRRELVIRDTATGKPLRRFPYEYPNFRSVAVSHDGSRVLTYEQTSRDFAKGVISLGGPMVVWDADSGKHLLEIKALVNWAILSPDGRRVAIPARDEKGAGPGMPVSIRILDVGTGKIAAELARAGDPVSRPTFNADGSRLATVADKELRMWNTESGKQTFAIPLDVRTTCGAFSPDGKRLAIVPFPLPGNRTAYILDAADGKSVATLSIPPATNTVLFSPDGRYVATAARNLGSCIHLSSATTGQPLQTIRTMQKLATFAFSADGKEMLTADWRQRLQAWRVQDAPTPKSERRFDPTQDVLKQAMTREKFTFSPDGSRVAFYRGPASQPVIIRDRDGKELVRFPHHSDGLSLVYFSADGTVVASVSSDEDAVLYLWETDTGKIRLKRSLGQEWRKVFLRLVLLNRDASRFAIPNTKNHYQVFETKTARELFVTPEPITESNDYYRVPQGALLSADGGTLAIQGLDNFEVWNVDSGKLVLKETRMHRFPFSFAFSPDGARLVGLVQREGSPVTNVLKVWDSPTGDELGALPLEDSLIAGPHMIFSPDGKRLAIFTTGIGASSAGPIMLVDVATVKTIGRFDGHLGRTNQVLFSPDGTRLASLAGGNGMPGTGTEIKLWDVATGRELLTLKNLHNVGALVFSRDGHRLISRQSGFNEYQLQTWDATPRAQRK
jgi:serine/threonine protein kinase/WD40 repeat protein